MDNLAGVLETGDLAMAGEQAGFTVEQMIRILNGGFTQEQLLDLISYRLQKQKSPDRF